MTIAPSKLASASKTSSIKTGRCTASRVSSSPATTPSFPLFDSVRKRLADMVLPPTLSLTLPLSSRMRRSLGSEALREGLEKWASPTGKDGGNAYPHFDRTDLPGKPTASRRSAREGTIIRHRCGSRLVENVRSGKLKSARPLVVFRFRLDFRDRFRGAAANLAVLV